MSASSEVFPVDPGYYSLQPQRLSLGEFQRLSGRGIYGYLLGLFRGLMPFSSASDAAFWMPSFWEDTIVAPEEISERGLEAILPHIAEFEREGFRLARYQKSTDTLWLSLIDNCGATLCHSSGEYIANVSYQETRGRGVVLSKSIGFSLKSGIWVGVTNTNAYFDPVKPSKIMGLPGATTGILWQRVQQECEVLVGQGESLATYPTIAQWVNATDRLQARVLHDRVNVRKLYRKLTEAEVEALLQRMKEQH